MKMMNTKFILKGFWDGEPAYYVKLLNEKLNGNAVIHLSTSVDEAQKFDTPEEAEKMFCLLLTSMTLLTLITYMIFMNLG